MENQEKVKQIYDSLTPLERYGIRMGIFPYRIEPLQIKYEVSNADLMQYDKQVREGNQESGTPARKEDEHDDVPSL